MIGFVRKMSDKFDKLLEEMSRLGIGNRDELKGCTSRQIQRLENKLGVTIPESYRRYLQLMGQDSARLFAHDRIHVKYADVLDLTVDATAFLADWSNDKPTNPNNCSLPSDALVILYRDSCDDYNFIRCNRATDSSVWHFNQEIWPPKAVFRSVHTWLKAWCGEAALAVQDGYYS